MGSAAAQLCVWTAYLQRRDPSAEFNELKRLHPSQVRVISSGGFLIHSHPVSQNGPISPNETMSPFAEF